MNPDEGARELLLEIVHCPNVPSCLQGLSRSHACRQIVESQRSRSMDGFQVPEPWSGHLFEAPLLFPSSNPSISETDQYPTRSWRDYEIEAYFYQRFQQSIVDGIRTRQSYSKPVRFWSEVRSRAAELYERAVTPGEDYALTEVVHCKSRKNYGVKQALKECSDRYLSRVLLHSNANVVVCLGVLVKQVVTEKFRIPPASGFMDPLRFAAKSATSCSRPNQTRISHGSFRKPYLKTNWPNSQKA
jgi:hypothetical protein